MNIIENNDCGKEPKRCKKHPEPGKALLNCSTGGVGPLPIISTVLARPIPVVSVTLDTTKVCSPVVLLTFTGQVNLPIGVLVTLNFVINRSCDGGAPQQIGGTYTFATLVDILEAESFAFQFCDHDPCPGCCTYTVELSTTSLVNITPGVTITNATLSALAVERD
jgi:hypothetical protein